MEPSSFRWHHSTATVPGRGGTTPTRTCIITKTSMPCPNPESTSWPGREGTYRPHPDAAHGTRIGAPGLLLTRSFRNAP